MGNFEGWNNHPSYIFLITLKVGTIRSFGQFFGRLVQPS
jgi:hypothetical protein